MSFLGLDVGTSGCKAAAFADDGRRLGYAYRPYALIHPRPGWAELDSAAVLAACRAATAEAAGAAAAAGAPVRALAVSSQGEAVTPVDAAGRILANAQVSSDARALDQVAAWAPRRDELYAITGHTAHPLFTLFKLAWWRRHEPRLWQQAAGFHCFEDLVHRDLGLDPAIGWPLAARTMLFDVRKGSWDAGLLAELGLDAGKLARPLPSGAPVGTVGAAAAAAWGLPAGVLVAAGGHDQQIAALGAGVTRPGMAMYATGTVECIAPLAGRAVFNPTLAAANLCTYPAALLGGWATVAFCTTGGNLLGWFRDQCGGGASFEQLLDGLSGEPTSLLALPYLSPSGTPHFDAGTPGAILGLRLTTTRGELLRGLLEGVLLEMRGNLELLATAGIPVDELRLTGGGARHHGWNQLKADVLGRPLAALDDHEAGCRGAAALGCAAATGTPAAAVANGWVRLGRVYQPDPARSVLYRERLERLRQLYPLVRDFTTRSAA